jgi:Holliday junction resolvasome RuvABC endonuclease subunit
VTYLLSIDQASSSGVAIFDLESGDLLEAFTLKSKSKDTWGARALDLTQQLREVAHEHLPHVSVIAYEKNKRTSVLVVSLPMAFAMVCPQARMNDSTGVTPSEWKAHVRRHVDTTNIHIKGIDALDALKPGWVEEYSIDSEDAADAVIIGLAFIEKMKKGKVGKKRRVDKHS